MSDDELMRGIRGGNSRDFQTLFGRHSNKVLGYSARMMGDMNKAEDVSQEVWIRVVRSAESYQEKGQFSSWLMTITRNTALNHLRKQTRWNTEEISFEGEEKFEDAKSELEESLDNKWQVEKVKAVIDGLPHSQRVALVMYMTEDMSYEDIGKELDLSLSAIKSLIFRARKTLIEKMGREQ